MTPEQIEIERKAFEADRRALGWDAERLSRFRGESWFGSQETMPTYRSDWTEGQWLGWLARAEKAERVREAMEKMLAACPEGNDGLLGRHIRVMPDLIEACRAARAALKEDTHG